MHSEGVTNAGLYDKLRESYVMRDPGILSNVPLLQIVPLKEAFSFTICKNGTKFRLPDTG